ncbi:MAG: hypothetical protein WDZ79_02630 [Candidatus Paceibacterota bacterium]
MTNRATRANQDGYALFISVVVLGVVAGVLVAALLSAGSTFLRTGSYAEAGERARVLADACAEVALQEINDDQNFEGNGSISFDIGSCEYSVSNLGGQSRRIEATGVAGEAVRRVVVETDSRQPEITVSLWQEVVSF